MLHPPSPNPGYPTDLLNAESTRGSPGERSRKSGVGVQSCLEIRRKVQRTTWFYCNTTEVRRRGKKWSEPQMVEMVQKWTRVPASTVQILKESTKGDLEKSWYQGAERHGGCMVTWSLVGIAAMIAMMKSSGTLQYLSGRILGTFACALTLDSEPFPPAHFSMAVSLLFVLAQNNHKTTTTTIYSFKDYATNGFGANTIQLLDFNKAVQQHANTMQLPTTTPLAPGMVWGLWVRYKVTGLLDRGHQGRCFHQYWGEGEVTDKLHGLESAYNYLAGDPTHYTNIGVKAKLLVQLLVGS
ncbi:hypothetical protein B0H14DRAFT_2654606 [Mycena olivaceomarginata]|nr:hypothetical protein B0H14DRAFT_2654606 [Mycena olivaceomarginata]